MTSTSPSYDQKVLYQLSKCSELVTGLPCNPLKPREDLEKQLYQKIRVALGNYKSPDKLGPWTIAWGPIVLVVGNQADNSMYVARSEDDPSRYVVAIAGTNPISLFDWLVNDLYVKQMISWKKVMGETKGSTEASETASIAEGTKIGLVNLLGAKPSGDHPQAGNTLVTFLLGLQKPIKLITTGHSKGGALSPTLALWLKDNQSTWDPNGQSQISSMPTAGPTAGNSAFAAYSDKTLPTVTRFANSLDIVPHAWNQDQLEKIRQLYDPPIPTKNDPMVKQFVDCAKKAAAQGGGDYTQLQSNPLWRIEGKINTDIIIPGPPPTTTFANFSAQALCQHTGAYDDYFSIPGVDIRPPYMQTDNQFCTKYTPILFPAPCVSVK